MGVSECCDPHRSIDTVCFNNPTRDHEMKTPSHSQNTFFFLLFPLKPLQQILGKMREGRDEIATQEYFWGRDESNGMHADRVSISTNILYVIIFFPAPSSVFQFRP